NGFKITVYYTPKQSGFTSGGGYNMTLITKPGLSNQKYPTDFLNAVEIEGFGKLATPYVSGGTSYGYISHDGNNVWDHATEVLGNRNNVLVAKKSCAVADNTKRTVPNTGSIYI